ncbi:MAG: hypothetical protein RL398_1846 [Planctomycetota bacterium]
MQITLYVLAAVGAGYLTYRAYLRILLSMAKHRSLSGHARMAQRLAKLLPFYSFRGDRFYAADDAPADVAGRRRAGFERLAELLSSRAPETIRLSREIEAMVSDVAFTNAYRVPFPFRDQVRDGLAVGAFASATEGRRIRDLDGNWSYDLGGSYGCNLFGYDFYKGCIDRASARARELGPVLGPYHPSVADNVRRLRRISGLDEVSFHMSGTEAVMQAVRLARYHTGRSHIVRFCGAYHGWWDGVQAGVGNPRPPREVYTLEDMHDDTLRVLRKRNDIACVLVNAIQAMNPNAGAPSDSTLVGGGRRVRYDRAAYGEWLRRLREVCTERGIVLIIDDVFLGFRLALGGTQEYFGIKADIVTYGKSLGGGLPVGVVCGRSDLMRRYRDDKPSDVCFARGTFNSHPYVMAAMNEFLLHLEQPDVREHYRELDAVWEARAESLNRSLEGRGLPVRVANMTSVWTVLYRQPGRYHWMLQYYLREQGLSMSWIGTGRFIFSHDYTDADFAAVADRFVAAAERMREDGWWWSGPALTEKSIKRRMLREAVTTVMRGA